ncbi:hypothetical protein B0A48_06062 [Cryoendolithus antarcticus]|uniref:F-box domain-containing protein n=1 Tax=Cryoendolithus antarcticus TaxID=1507870 RepID=A0A1V8TD52_9PEZI|nr:hypothetical protein B0A48_06062 [Cryoendolithus antarcticus]
MSLVNGAHQPQSNPLGRCLLLELPPELRLEIYHHLIDPATAKAICTVVLDTKGEFRLRCEQNQRAVLLTCRIIYMEYRPLIRPAQSSKIHIDMDNFRSSPKSETRRLRSTHAPLHRLQENAQILEATSLIVYIDGRTTGGNVMRERLWVAVEKTFRTIAKAQELRTLKVCIAVRDDFICDEICREIAARRYKCKCEVSVPPSQIQGSTRAMLHSLARAVIVL